ncbi:GNAT family N-acetyltransferase [Niallia taxi]|uniref:GNAT family N-acetyltransferase n=1 Tax=Niallia taxi TaxID=2499688 RepID=UPI00398267DA
MLIHLNQADELAAGAIHKLQKLSYQVEADLIEYDDLPPLKESLFHIQNSCEVFIGWKVNKELVGVLSYEETENILLISRLIVHPAYFQQGVASSLLNSLLEKRGKPVHVCTAAKNTPAVRLYQKWGFEITKTFTPAGGPVLVHLEIK